MSAFWYGVRHQTLLLKETRGLRLKILLLSHYWYPENGVPQRRWKWLTEILTAQGHEILVIAPPPHYQARESLSSWVRNLRSCNSLRSKMGRGPVGETIIRTGYVPAGSSLTGRMVNQASVAVGSLYVSMKRSGHLKKFNPDIVIGTVPALPTAPLSFLVSKMLGVPYIIDLRDAWPDLLRQSDRWNSGVRPNSIGEEILLKGPFRILSYVVRLTIEFVLARATAIITTSSELEVHLQEKYSHRRVWLKKEFGTIRNVFPSEIDYLKEARLSAETDHLNVIYAGTIGRAQKLQNAIQAVKKAQERGTQVNLRLVGTGAAVSALKTMVKDLQLNSVDFIERVRADELSEHYEWADTALVHLTDWEPLSRAVPSKTYELMSIGLHISGVLSGESAALIDSLEAGDVVLPEDTEALADLWCELARNREKLRVSSQASMWVENERKVVVPDRLSKIIAGVSDLNGKR